MACQKYVCCFKKKSINQRQSLQSMKAFQGRTKDFVTGQLSLYVKGTSISHHDSVCN